ncbi:MAG: hypothetical protein Q9201_000143 [Fulgogasparrea decipioides]
MAEASILRAIDEATVDLLTAYQELNGAYVDELEEDPSPLVFMQHVAQNRPFVVRGAATDWPALSLWNPEYLNTTMGDSTVKDLVLMPESSSDEIPWPLWDPDNPGANKNRFSSLSRPLRIELEPGDLLYLPALW